MQVKPHTKIKHNILDAYFAICKAVAKKLGKLNYIDLYAGDGEGECLELNPAKWDIPIISFLNETKDSDFEVACYMNDIDPENYKKLKEKLNPYLKQVKRIECKNANEVYIDFLGEYKPTQWSIVLLDPYTYSQLEFKTIEGLSQHKGYYYGTTCRQPELIISFMTLGMQRNLKDEDGINKALGISESRIWKDRIDRGEKTYEVFLDIMLRQLQKLGYFCVYFSIEQTRPSASHLYYIIFASNNPKAFDIIDKKFAPYISKMMEQKWIKENYSFRLISNARKQKISCGLGWQNLSAYHSRF